MLFGRGDVPPDEVVAVKRFISPLLVAGDLGEEIDELTGAVATYGTTSTPTRDGRRSPTERPYLTRIRDRPPDRASHQTTETGIGTREAQIRDRPPDRARARRQSPTRGQTLRPAPDRINDRNLELTTSPRLGSDSEPAPVPHSVSNSDSSDSGSVPNSPHPQDQTVRSGRGLQ